ncbi:NADH-quinone oxidoreductase subunit L [Oscillospiraceae bacterium HV4-5-C5C]|nr:NADH-quinone oxidoreductase subunit L [Oscillospiraceae bacterium HV4-5-C5C]
MTILSICAHGFVYCPILVVLIYNLFNHEFARKHFIWFAGAGATWQILTSAAGFFVLHQSGQNGYAFGALWDPGLPGSAYFELSGPRFLLLLIVGLVAFVSVLVAHHTVDFNRSSYTNLLMILVLGMNGMLLVTDLFSLYVFMEVTGLCCFIMIAMFRSRADLEGSFKYLILSELSSIFILTAVAFLMMKTGSLRYTDLAGLGSRISAGSGRLEDVLFYAALVLLISGFAIKTGVVPFHSWLPDAYQSADTAVSILLSGAVNKVAGVYGLIVVMELFGDVAPVGKSLAAVGIVSIIIGALLAVRQPHYKRVVAYSSVSQMGYILLALSTGTTLGLVAALAHIFSHTAFKSTLFTNAAALQEQAGTLELQDLGGLENQMPVTAFTSIIAFLSTAGIPPTAGFWSKILIILALWQAGSPVLAAVALIAGILSSAYLIRLQRTVFFGQTRPELAGVKEAHGSVLTAEILLTVITLGLGLLYPYILMLLHAGGIL